MYVCGYVHVGLGAFGGQKKVSDTLVTGDCNLSLWVLGTSLGSSPRAVLTLNSQALSWEAFPLLSWGKGDHFG